MTPKEMTELAKRHAHQKILIAKWMDILRLGDWDVELKHASFEYMTNGVIGSITTYASIGKATITLRDDVDEDDEEGIIVHELLHLRLHGRADDFTPGDEMELGIDRLSQALIALKDAKA